MRAFFRSPAKVGPGLIALLALAQVACGSLATVPSLPQVKAELKDYVASGRYAADVARVVERAESHLLRRAPRTERPALVLDIDETALSNWAYEHDTDFCYSRDTWASWVAEAAATPIEPTLELYRRALASGVAVFFITGRREPFRDDTAENLRRAGYEGWTRLYLRPADDERPSAAAYKSGARREIAAEGYTIVVNMGDQASDLEGGYAERTFKLPNPFYGVP